MIMRFILLGFMLFIISAEVNAADTNARPAIIDGVAARVNEEVITIGDVMVVLKPLQNQLSRRYAGEELRTELNKAYTEALNMLIGRQLILDSYKKQKELVIPETVVEERIEMLTQDMFQGDQSKLMSALKEEGMIYDEWRGEIKNHIIASYMRKLAVDDNIKISPKLIREAYENEPDKYKTAGKAKLRMIVLKKDLSGGGNEQKRQKAQEIRKRLAEGGDFAVIAASDSEGDKAKDGGDWGWVELGILRPELAEAAASLKTGEISEVIEVKEELYILKVEERKDAEKLSFVDAQPRIERELRLTEAEKLYNSWVGRLREKSCVQVFDVNIYK